METGWLAGLTAQHERREAKHAAQAIWPELGVAGQLRGLLASAIGLTVLGLGLAAWAGYAIAPWTERVEIEPARPVFASEDDERADHAAVAAERPREERVVPTGFTLALSVLGSVMAGLGISDLVQRGVIPWLYVLVLAACWLPVVVGFWDELVRLLG
ncbi:MAG: hypothetical protein KatS3mg108_2382 [Isosphaeraceae bacterium]|jgi:hypothetical protein|nr:MAG: hypothetical protein KatS3mg108_2382 [Isosphaeraceae bacterium]